MQTIKNDRIYILDAKEGNMVASAIMSHMKALQELVDSVQDEESKRGYQEMLDEYRELFNNLND